MRTTSSASTQRTRRRRSWPDRVTATPSLPSGWLFDGAQSSLNISGNNVNAYLDAVSDNKPDPGGDVVTDGQFLTEADLTQSPTTEDNREVAVQNLFYLNNVIHDTLRAAGFTEAAGNFQEEELPRRRSRQRLGPCRGTGRWWHRQRQLRHPAGRRQPAATDVPVDRTRHT